MCFPSRVVERADDFQACEYAIRAIKSAPCGLGIKMASGRHGGTRRIQSVAACKDVSHLIYTDHTSGIFAPANEQIPTRFIEVGQRQTTDAAVPGGTDSCHSRQTIPEAIAVDAHAFHGVA